MGAALGIAVFGALFTSRLTENLTTVFTGAGATAEQAGKATSTIDPSVLDTLPDALRDGVVEAYADALAPVFWYLVPCNLIVSASTRIMRSHVRGARRANGAPRPCTRPTVTSCLPPPTHTGDSA